MTKLPFLLGLGILFIICAVCKALFSSNRSSTSKVMAIHMYDARGGTCYVGVPGDVPFSWVHFLPENSKAGYQF